MRYLAIQISGDVDSQYVFFCASDTAYSDDVNTQHSTDNYFFKLFGGAID